RDHRRTVASTSSSSSGVGARADAPSPRCVWLVRRSAVLARRALDAVAQSHASGALRHRCAAVPSAATRLTRYADRLNLYSLVNCYDQQLPDSPSTATRRAPQLLRARGVIP